MVEKIEQHLQDSSTPTVKKVKILRMSTMVFYFCLGQMLKTKLWFLLAFLPQEPPSSNPSNLLSLLDANASLSHLFNMHMPSPTLR